MDAQIYLQVEGTLPIINNLTDEKILAEVSPDQNVAKENDEKNNYEELPVSVFL